MMIDRPGRVATQKHYGMVSIMVTMIMMIVISLIVLGFAQVSRREQRQSLDRQLSAQAFFAAESGINDVRRAISALPAGADIPEKDDCATSMTTTPYAFDPVIDPVHNVSYTCLLVTTKLKNISVNVSDKGDAVNVPLQPTGGVATKLHINWTPPNPTTIPAVASGCDNNLPGMPPGYFPRSSDWDCPFGVLRVDFVPTDNLDRSVMAATQKTVFFYPTRGTGSGTLDYNAANGAVAPMECAYDTGCNIDVVNLPAVATYALRLSAVYGGGKADITVQDASSNDLELKNAQIQVDATGKAEDVLRRVQVRLPMVPSAKTANYAIQSASSICKRFEIGPRSFIVPNDINGQDPNNPMCLPQAHQPICTVQPHELILVLDQSGSMRQDWQTGTRMEKMVEVAHRLISDTGISEAGTHASIVTFDSEGHLLQPLTSDIPVLQSTIDTIRPGSSTNYTQGLNLALQEYASGRARDGVPKVVIFMSDGQPTEDEDAIMPAVNSLKALGVTIYTVAINLDIADHQLLSDMATSPGHFVAADQEAQLEQAIFDISTQFVCN